LGNLPRARELLEQSLQIRQQYANSYRIASALRSLGELALAEGNLSLAETQLQEALALYTASGRVDGLGPTHLALARVAMGRGEGEGNTAVFHIHTALRYAIQLQLPAQGLDSLRHWAEYCWQSGNRDEAIKLFRYLLAHPNCSGFLARQMHTFFAAQTPPMTLPEPEKEKGENTAVAWQNWLFGISWGFVIPSINSGQV
jgi:tetratricopeptide (TPR) repeat protein